jgi:hypothetical protein
MRHMCKVLSRVYGVTIDGFGLVIGFIEHLKIATTCNSSTTANSHALQFTRAHISLL